jgi:proliferating cell nuclear antigen
MKVRLDNPKLFSDVISIISELVTEVKIKVNKDGMSIVAIDPANVAMTVFILPAPAFSVLEVEEENLGVNLDNLKAVLRRCSVGSSLIMSTEDNFIKLEIVDKIKREFTLTLIDLEKKDKPVPTLEFTSKVEINSIDLGEAIEDCAIVADSCSFEASADKFMISAKGPLNSATLTYSSDEARIEAPTPNKAKYSIDYLQKMIRGAKIAEKTIINFGQDYPLKLEFRAPLMELSFILAPRVESED